MTSQERKIRSNWWYLLPIFLGIVGGVIAWFALKSDDRQLAKNCFILGIILDLVEIGIIISLAMFTDTLNLITEIETISETNDFDFQFHLESP